MARPAAFGEQSFIDFISRRARGSRPRPVVGIGDDAAILALPSGGQTILTTDLLTDGVHFRWERTPGTLLGRKALSVNLSDVAAMGAVPHSCVAAIGLPGRLPPRYARAVAAGLVDMAKRSGVALVGGDTCAARALFINVTLVGVVEPGRAVTRGGARPGDGLYVTGSVGASGTGLMMLEQASRRRRGNDRRIRGSKAVARRRAIRAHLDPVPRIVAGRALGLAGMATAMIDLSDGLAKDLPRICRASGTGAVILEAAVPVAGAAIALLGKPAALRQALCGGEDYELLFTARPDRAMPIARLARSLRLPISRIGQILPRRAGITIRDRAGLYKPLPSGGFEHFPGQWTAGRRRR